MTKGKRTTALALAGAVALASGAYALGAQADDGSAEAAKTARDEARFGHGFGRAGPAPRAATRVRRPRGPPRRRRGRSPRRARGHRAPTARTSSPSGSPTRSASTRRRSSSAFENVRPERPARPRVRRPEALRRARSRRSSASAPRRSAPRSRSAAATRRTRATSPTSSASARSGYARPSTPCSASSGRTVRGLANLAEELGVTQAQLEAAFEKLRDQKDELRDEFAQELADRLNLDVEKVQDALDALHGPGRPGGCPETVRRRGVPRGRACTTGGSASRSGSERSCSASRSR